MLVRERMSSPVITVSPELSISETLLLMREKNIRRTPVVDQDKIIGIISDKDLFDLTPTMKSYLKDWDQDYMAEKITVSQVMRPVVVTVDENTTVEQAAIIMTDNKIGGLPVTRDGKLIGMITDTDVFQAFIEMLGARSKGIRITVIVKNIPGELAKLTNAIATNNGNIVALSTFEGGAPGEIEGTIKVTGIELSVLDQLIQPLVVKLVDIRET